MHCSQDCVLSGPTPLAGCALYGNSSTVYLYFDLFDLFYDNQMYFLSFLTEVCRFRLVCEYEEPMRYIHRNFMQKF